MAVLGVVLGRVVLGDGLIAGRVLPGTGGRGDDPADLRPDPRHLPAPARSARRSPRSGRRSGCRRCSARSWPAAADRRLDLVRHRLARAVPDQPAGRRCSPSSSAAACCPSSEPAHAGLRDSTGVGIVLTRDRELPARLPARRRPDPGLAGCGWSPCSAAAVPLLVVVRAAASAARLRAAARPRSSSSACCASGPTSPAWCSRWSSSAASSASRWPPGCSSRSASGITPMQASALPRRDAPSARSSAPASAPGPPPRVGRPILHVGLAIMAVGHAASSTRSLHQAADGAARLHRPGARACSSTVLGMGMIFVPLFSIIMGEIDDHEVGSASGLLESLPAARRLARASPRSGTLFFDQHRRSRTAGRSPPWLAGRHLRRRRGHPAGLAGADRGRLRRRLPAPEEGPRDGSLSRRTPIRQRSRSRGEPAGSQTNRCS